MSDRTGRVGEPRWPMALAVLAIGGLHALLPADFTVFPPLALEAVLAGLLIALVIGDPGRIDRDSPALRWVTGAVIVVITLANVAAGFRLVRGILIQATFTDARELLLIGAVVWTVNVLLFALAYWALDAGGAAARAQGSHVVPRAFVFPEESLPENADGTWFPQFVDYLTMSFYTATAFSPTDVSAVRRWAKMLMVLESSVSLVVALLVIARAVNIWPS